MRSKVSQYSLSFVNMSEDETVWALRAALILLSFNCKLDFLEWAGSKNLFLLWHSSVEAAWNSHLEWLWWRSVLLRANEWWMRSASLSLTLIVGRTELIGSSRYHRKKLVKGLPWESVLNRYPFDGMDSTIRLAWFMTKARIVTPCTGFCECHPWRVLPWMVPIEKVQTESSTNACIYSALSRSNWMIEIPKKILCSHEL